MTARVEIADPARRTGQGFLDLLAAAARGDIVSIPVLVRLVVGFWITSLTSCDCR